MQHKVNSRVKKFLVISLSVFLGIALWLYYQAGPGFLMLIKMQNPVDKTGITTSQHQIRLSDQTIAVRVYTPVNGYDKVMIAVHGIHYDGYDELRLTEFALKMSQMRFAVVTPDVEDLKNYEITTRAIENIKQTVLWTTEQSQLLQSHHKLGICGFSFSGGLGLSAAASPELREKVDFVFSFGGHGDLKQTMKYLVTGELPDGENLTPHMYAVAVLLLKFADKCVDTEHVPALRDNVLSYLREQKDNSIAKRDQLASETAKKLVNYCLDWKPQELGEVLQPYVIASEPSPELSPVQGTPPQCPVFLLHGSIDSVIPPFQTVELSKWANGNAETLVSNVIRHVELGTETEVTWLDYWKLAVFMTKFLRC